MGLSGPGASLVSATMVGLLPTGAASLFLWKPWNPALINRVLLPGRGLGRGPQASLGALFRAAPREEQGASRLSGAGPSQLSCQTGAASAEPDIGEQV